MLRAPLPTTLNYYLAIHSNDSFWTVQKDQASLSAVLPTTPRRPVQTGRLRARSAACGAPGEPTVPAGSRMNRTESLAHRFLPAPLSRRVAPPCLRRLECRASFANHPL